MSNAHLPFWALGRAATRQMLGSLTAWREKKPPASLTCWLPLSLQPLFQLAWTTRPGVCPSVLWLWRLLLLLFLGTLLSSGASSRINPWPLCPSLLPLTMYIRYGPARFLLLSASTVRICTSCVGDGWTASQPQCPACRPSSPPALQPFYVSARAVLAISFSWPCLPHCQCVLLLVEVRGSSYR